MLILYDYLHSTKLLPLKFIKYNANTVHFVWKLCFYVSVWVTISWLSLDSWWSQVCLFCHYQLKNVLLCSFFLNCTNFWSLKGLLRMFQWEIVNGQCVAELVSLICTNCQCPSVQELLCGCVEVESVVFNMVEESQSPNSLFPSGLFRHILDYLRPHLLKDNWKKFPLACHGLVWCTLQIKVNCLWNYRILSRAIPLFQ